MNKSLLTALFALLVAGAMGGVYFSGVNKNTAETTNNSYSQTASAGRDIKTGDSTLPPPTVDEVKQFCPNIVNGIARAYKLNTVELEKVNGYFSEQNEEYNLKISIKSTDGKTYTETLKFLKTELGWASPFERHDCLIKR